MSHCDACNKEGDFSFSIQVHSFPRDAQLRKQWIRAVQHVIEGWTPKEDSVLCSKHFEESCYKEPDPVLGKRGMMCRGLRDNAVPTIFKTAKKTVPVQSHRENGRLGSDEKQRHLPEDGQEARTREQSTTANKQDKEELQLRSSSSTQRLNRSNGEVDIGAIPMSGEGSSATCDKEVVHDEQSGNQEGIVAVKTDEKETNPGVLIDGDLNLPLRKVFEQIANIKEERVRRAAVDQDGREGADRWWNSASQDFRINLETYMQQLETSRSNIPVTFDTAMSTTLSLLGDSQEIVRVKEELTVPCLGKLYSRVRSLCPRCGNILDDMMNVVHHLCKAKKKALESGRFFSSIPDIVFVKDKHWKRFLRSDPSKSWKKAKKPEVTSGLVDVFGMQEMHRPSEGPSSQNCGIEKTKMKKGTCNRNLWKKLKLKQISPKRSSILKKMEKEKEKKKKKKKKRILKGKFTTVKMHVKAKPVSKTVTEHSKEKEVEENRERERKSVKWTNFGELTTEAAADLLFSDLETRGLVSVKKELVDPEYKLLPDMGYSDGQSMANSVNVPQVYPVSIIPSSLLLTSLNTAPCSVSNNSMDLDVKLFPESLMGPLLPHQVFPSPVPYGNPGAVRCSRCDSWCENENELGWHRCPDTSSAPPVGGGGGDGYEVGGGGITDAGITLSDGTVVKAEPMDDGR